MEGEVGVGGDGGVQLGAENQFAVVPAGKSPDDVAQQELAAVVGAVAGFHGVGDQGLDLDDFAAPGSRGDGEQGAGHARAILEVGASGGFFNACGQRDDHVYRVLPVAAVAHARHGDELLGGGQADARGHLCLAGQRAELRLEHFALGVALVEHCYGCDVVGGGHGAFDGDGGGHGVAVVYQVGYVELHAACFDWGAVGEGGDCCGEGVGEGVCGC